MTEAIKSEAPAPAEAPKVATILEAAPESAPRPQKKSGAGKYFLYLALAVGGYYAYAHYHNKKAKQELLDGFEEYKKKNPLMRRDNE